MIENNIRIINQELRHIKKVYEQIKDKSGLKEVDHKLESIWKDLIDLSCQVDNIYMEDWKDQHNNPGEG